MGQRPGGQEGWHHPRYSSVKGELPLQRVQVLMSEHVKHSFAQNAHCLSFKRFPYIPSGHTLIHLEFTKYIKISPGTLVSHERH